MHLPSGEEMTIFEAAERYLAEGVPPIVLAGKEYGSGSSRDWAAKGPNLLGVRAVIAESYERIHRSNLLMMGILPLQFLPGENRESLGLTGREEFSVTGVENGEAREVTVRADGREFRATLRLDTPREREYVRHGGILPYVLRNLLADVARSGGRALRGALRPLPDRRRRRDRRTSAGRRSGSPIGSLVASRSSRRSSASRSSREAALHELLREAGACSISLLAEVRRRSPSTSPAACRRSGCGTGSRRSARASRRAPRSPARSAGSSARVRDEVAEPARTPFFVCAVDAASCTGGRAGARARSRRGLRARRDDRCLVTGVCRRASWRFGAHSTSTALDSRTTTSDALARDWSGTLETGEPLDEVEEELRGQGLSGDV